jgi:SAM-dependent methyltransferase
VHVKKTTLPTKTPSGEGLDLSPLYPDAIRQLDNLHWSPLRVIQLATQFLAAEKDTRILDIGSGSGKFCLTGSSLRPNALFYGVEQRKNLVDQANAIRDLLDRPRVRFIHNNFTQLDFKTFDSFYFYNSFFENLPGTEKIDDSIDYSTDLYHYYSKYLSMQLDRMPRGTRVATYCSWDDEIPLGYRLKESHIEGLLKLWIKV